MIMQKERQIKAHIAKMSLLFQEADETGDGRLSFKEFSEVVEDKNVDTWLKSMDIEVHDAKSTFNLIDNGDGYLTAEELVRGLARLKGCVRSMDMALLMKKIGTIEEHVLPQDVL